MDSTSRAVLVANQGIRGNANYADRRQITIISLERWRELTDELGADVDPSARRANLLVSGIDLAESRGRLLLIGSCGLRVGGETRPCERMDEASPGLQAVMRARWGGGAWAVIEVGGEVALGDPVRWADV